MKEKANPRRCQTSEYLKSHSSLNNLTSPGLRTSTCPASPRINSERPEKVQPPPTHTHTVFTTGRCSQGEESGHHGRTTATQDDANGPPFWNHVQALQRPDHVGPWAGSEGGGGAGPLPAPPPVISAALPDAHLCCDIVLFILSPRPPVQTEPERCHS